MPQPIAQPQDEELKKHGDPLQSNLQSTDPQDQALQEQASQEQAAQDQASPNQAQASPAAQSPASEDPAAPTHAAAGDHARPPKSAAAHSIPAPQEHGHPRSAAAHLESAHASTQSFSTLPRTSAGLRQPPMEISRAGKQHR